MSLSDQYSYDQNPPRSPWVSTRSKQKVVYWNQCEKVFQEELITSPLTPIINQKDNVTTLRRTLPPRHLRIISTWNGFKRWVSSVVCWSSSFDSAGSVMWWTALRWYRWFEVDIRGNIGGVLAEQRPHFQHFTLGYEWIQSHSPR